MKKHVLALALCLSAVGCTKDFDSINTNPNEPQKVSGDLLLRTAVFDLANFLVYQTYGFNDIVAQYTAQYEYNQIDIYNWTSDDRFWNLYDVLQNLQDVKAYGVESNRPHYEAVALILETYAYSILTDGYGDVPYSESNQAEKGNITPRYDTQESIYTGMLAALTRANDLIDTGGESLSGDLLFGGDLLKWKKFANSLRVRLLMRTSNVEDVSAELQAIANDPDAYPVFDNTTDGAIYFYSGKSPDISPYSEGVGREYEYFIGVPTTHLVNTLLKNNDPRIHEWLGYHVKEDSTLEYLGLEPGLDQGDINRPVDYSSLDSSYFYEPAKISAVFMTYSELCFLFAEAAARNLINADAADWYNRGVSASFEQWNVAMPDDFLTTTAPYDATHPDRLYEQKWLALFHSGVEAWFDWKRTGKPNFIQAGPGNLNDGRVPVRLLYPSLEQSVNGTHYREASTRMGGDDINTRVWWDK